MYSDDAIIAFLCEPPATWGHTLVVTRRHRDDLWATEREEAAAATEVARRLGTSSTSTCTSCRYENDTVLPGCVWGMPPWKPPPGGDSERRGVADALRRGLAGDSLGLE